MELKARFDQIVGLFKGHNDLTDPDYMPPAPAKRYFHFTFGKPGEEIVGGIYIKSTGEEFPKTFPKTITIHVPDPWS